MDKIEKVQVLTLREGDILIANITDRNISNHEMQELQHTIEEYLPDSVKVMVIKGVDITVVRTANPD